MLGSGAYLVSTVRSQSILVFVPAGEFDFPEVDETVIVEEGEEASEVIPDLSFCPFGDGQAVVGGDEEDEHVSVVLWFD